MFQIIDAVCMDDNMEELANQVDVIFTATPQGYCASLLKEEILSKVKIIDLSADFRIKDQKVYEECTRSSTKVRSFYRKRCTDCVKLTGRRSRGQEFWQIRDVIDLLDSFHLSACQRRIDRYEYADYRRKVRNIRSGKRS